VRNIPNLYLEVVQKKYVLNTQLKLYYGWDLIHE